MSKVFALLILIFLSVNAIGQTQQNRSSPTVTVADARLKAIYNFYIPKGADTSLFNGLDSVGALFFKIPENSLWVRVAISPIQNKWERFFPSTTTFDIDSTFNGDRPITRDFSTVTGVNLGSQTIKQTLNQLLYPSQPPTATLTGGGTMELMATGTQLPFTLSYTAGRQSATATLATIVVAGITETFAQPNPSSNVTGTQAVSVSRNTTTSFSNAVTTTDGKTAIATVTYTFLPKRYWGFVSSTSPSDGTIQALTNEFVSTRIKAPSSSLSPTGTQYFAIAFPQSLDVSDISQIWVGGLDQTGTFTRTVRTFVNASGYSQSYIFYVSTNPTAGAVSFEIK